MLKCSLVERVSQRYDDAVRAGSLAEEVVGLGPSEATPSTVMTHIVVTANHPRG